MLKNFSQALNKLKSLKDLSEAPHLTLIHGESDYLIRKAIISLSTHWQELHPDICIENHEAKKVSEQVLAQMLSENSLFSPQTIYIIKRCEQAPNIFKNLENIAVISSGKKDELVAMSLSGVSLTNYFVKNLKDGKTIKTAFDEAKTTYTSQVNNVPQAYF